MILKDVKMNSQELKQEVINLAYSLGDPDGLEKETLIFISVQMALELSLVKEIMNESLFDLDY